MSLQSDQHFESPAIARVVCIDDYRPRFQSKRADVQEKQTIINRELEIPWTYEFMVRSSKTLRRALIDLPDVAQTALPVLITAESGMGTEIFARAIHKLSHCPPQAFVRVNCAAMPQSSFGSELFYRLNSEYSAAQPRPGCFQLAEKGTIFLDGIEHLLPDDYLDLLQVLASSKYESHPRNVRLIGSINSDRKKALLRTVSRTSSSAGPIFLRIPPLRERKEDIPALVRRFFFRHASIFEKKIHRLSQKTMKTLQSYPWPGNLCELQHVLERFVALAEAEILSVDAQWISWETSFISEAFVPGESELIEAALLEMLAELPGWDPETCREIWMETSDHETTSEVLGWTGMRD